MELLSRALKNGKEREDIRSVSVGLGRKGSHEKRSVWLLMVDGRSGGGETWRACVDFGTKKVPMKYLAPTFRTNMMMILTFFA
jgi:hypothetical protein